MDGEKGEFQALGGSLALDQKGEFQALRGTLSLDLSNCKLRNPQPTATSTEPRNDPTLEQKQYAQGFFDALRTVQQIHNFEFEKKVLSPGFIAPIVGSELLTPLISPSSRDYQAILNAMVAKTPIMQPTVGISTSSVLTPGFPTAVSAPGTSSTSSGAAAPSTSATSSTAPEPVVKVEVKQEPRCVSDDSTESDRSRSSSTTAHHSTRHSLKNDLELVMDEQEKRKLDRKRARNRAAATKCRQKKIDRIQELEGMVASEKQRAQGLDMEMENLRNTLHQLQQLIHMHEQRGCARS
ncbi:hypothetical protein V3C99_012313 [Haemonchus contortus]|uniref:BZIP domain-containing protein n=1 Tax=Haemonchus contortus TaxID=6289 RepID=A0A7I4Y589_HAECO